MKTLLVIGALLLAGAARADWHDLKNGLNQSSVVQAVGMPLIMSQSRGGAQSTWTYDAGGYIQFENRRVSYWQAPRGTVATKQTARGVRRAAAQITAGPAENALPIGAHTCGLCGRAHLVQAHRPRR